MSSIAFAGATKHRIASFLTLNRIILQVSARHCIGKKMAPDWDILTEVGIRFIRHQFTYAMTCGDIEKGRARFNSLLPKTPDIYPVSIRNTADGKAKWFIPGNCNTDTIVLYLHGGGYTFRGQVSDRFAQMLAQHTKARVFMPLYRLTPEHAHPAQAEDAIAAWQNLTLHTPPKQIAVIGDSAGGHMALMLLQGLKRLGFEQPALCVGLSPWTDIGEHGDSMITNNPTDLVQGWMALKFGRWLDPDKTYGRQALSPIGHNFEGLAPIYIQAGGREMLRDMIVDFARQQETYGADITLDVWDDMPHNFQAYDTTKTSSTEALKQIAARVRKATNA